MCQAYNRCVSRLTAQGMPEKEACRACRAAVYSATGYTLEECQQHGFEPPNELEPIAEKAYQFSSGQALEVVIGAATGTIAPADMSFQRQCVAAYAGSSGAAPGEAILYRPARLLYLGTFQAMVNGRPGNFVVSEGHIDAALRNFDARNRRVTLQLDHSMSVAHKVGNVVGLHKKGAGITAELHGLLEIIGAENVEKAMDGRYREVSVGARGYNEENTEHFALAEVSFVAAGALPLAGLARAGIAGGAGRGVAAGFTGRGGAAATVTSMPAAVARMLREELIDKKTAEGLAVAAAGMTEQGAAAYLREFERGKDEEAKRYRRAMGG